MEQSFKKEFIDFLDSHNVDTSKLKFRFYEQSPYQKNRYKPEFIVSEIWVYNKNGQHYGVVIKDEFEECKKMGEDGISFLIGQYPKKQYAKGGKMPEKKYWFYYKDYKVRVYTLPNEKSNYNISFHVFRKGEKSLLWGRIVSKKTTKQQIKDAIDFRDNLPPQSDKLKKGGEIKGFSYEIGGL